MVFAHERHPAYDHLDARKIMGERNGTQAGDPKKGGKAIYQLAVLEDPPLRVVIGSDAYKVCVFFFLLFYRCFVFFLGGKEIIDFVYSSCRRSWARLKNTGRIIRSMRRFRIVATLEWRNKNIERQHRK